MINCDKKHVKLVNSGVNHMPLDYFRQIEASNNDFFTPSIISLTLELRMKVYGTIVGRNLKLINLA